MKSLTYQDFLVCKVSGIAATQNQSAPSVFDDKGSPVHHVTTYPTIT